MDHFIQSEQRGLSGGRMKQLYLFQNRIPAVIILFTLEVMLMLTGPFSLQAKAETIMIATDPHHISETLTDDGPAFMDLLLSGDGKVSHYSTEIIEAFLDEAVRLHPDLVLLTGDLTFNGETVSHQELARLLDRLTAEGIPAAVFPGNHDLNNRSARSFKGSRMYNTPTATQEDFLNIYREFGYDRALERDPSSLGYVYAVSDTLWILCIDANTPSSPGILTADTLSWTESILKKAAGQSVRVIGATHQNLLAHNQIFIDGFRMGKSSELLSLYQKYGVCLNLSGHMHLQHISTAAAPDQNSSSVTDIATSALTVAPCHYAILEIQGENWNYHTAETPVKAAEIDSFADLARDFFNEITEMKTEEELSGASIPSDVREQMTTGFQALNLAYFSGYMDQADPVDPLLSLWQKYLPGSFWQVYLLSIMKEEPADMNSAQGSLSPCH